MTKNKFELDENRLATTDEKGLRVYIHPEDIKGVWQQRKKITYWFLISLYLILPWIHIKGKQSILLNILKREFTFFGTTFYAHDAPLILLFLLIFIFLMGFITSQWGRVWCGWSCPQTVFIDALYRKVERWVEGNARKRAKLEEQPWNINKVLKKSAKWFLFTLISLHIAHSFLGYFVGTRELFQITLHSPAENWTLFTIMLSLTALCLFDFGWFREQFCLIACPYGRIQSVMMDEHTKTIVYDFNRGEPRRGQVDRNKEGDCINCYHCVKACPTGIDIRRGTQLECIACTNCIDACDEIMDKINKPQGLIRFDSEIGLAKNAPAQKYYRPYIYLTIIFALVVAFFYAINVSHQLNITLIRNTGKPYLSLRDNQIVNLYKVRVDYKSDEPLNLNFRIKGNKEEQIEIVTPHKPFKLTGKGTQKTLINFRFPKSILSEGKKVITLQAYEGDVIIEKEVKLVGPLK